MIDIVTYNIYEGIHETYTSKPDKNLVDVYSIDPRQFVSEAFSITDYTKYIECYKNKFIEFITYKDKSALYYFYKPTKGARPNDGYGGVIIIPSDSDISGSELSGVISKMRNVLADSTIDEKGLDEIKKDYGLRTEKEICSDSCNNYKYASQEYSDYDQIRNNLFSSCYRSYKAVFISNNKNEYLKDTVEKIDDETIRNYREETPKDKEIQETLKKSKLPLYCLVLLLLLCFSTLGFFIGRVTMKEKYENEVSKIESSCQQEINALNDSINNLNEKIINISDEIDEKNERIKSKDKEIKSLKNTINQKNKEIEQLKDNNQILKNKLEINDITIPD